MINIVLCVQIQPGNCDSIQSMCLCILLACQAAEQVKVQCMQYHMIGADHARFVPGIARSSLAVLLDAAGPTKLVQHMSALRQHAYIHVAAVVHCAFSAVVSTPRMQPWLAV